jgi:hypothetical protein
MTMSSVLFWGIALFSISISSMITFALILLSIKILDGTAVKQSMDRTVFVFLGALGFLFLSIFLAKDYIVDIPTFQQGKFEIIRNSQLIEKDKHFMSKGPDYFSLKFGKGPELNAYANFSNIEEMSEGVYYNVYYLPHCKELMRVEKVSN